jgi:TPR repeat protein
VSKDEVEAAKWCRRAADQGSPVAESLLGEYYSKGFGVTKDMDEAVSWFKRAAAQGDVECQYNLGVRYQNGIGVVQDFKEAVKWYRKAADKGSEDAQVNLAGCIQAGLGVEKDDLEAARLYRKAADRGNLIALRNMGLCHLKGLGVAKDLVEAYAYFEVVVIKLEEMKKYLVANFSKLSPEELAYAESIMQRLGDVQAAHDGIDKRFLPHERVLGKGRAKEIMDKIIDAKVASLTGANHGK